MSNSILIGPSSAFSLSILKQLDLRLTISYCSRNKKMLSNNKLLHHEQKMRENASINKLQLFKNAAFCAKCCIVSEPIIGMREFVRPVLRLYVQQMERGGNLPQANARACSSLLPPRSLAR